MKAPHPSLLLSALALMLLPAKARSAPRSSGKEQVRQALSAAYGYYDRAYRTNPLSFFRKFTTSDYRYRGIKGRIISQKSLLQRPRLLAEDWMPSKLDATERKSWIKRLKVSVGAAVADVLMQRSHVEWSPYSGYKEPGEAFASGAEIVVAVRILRRDTWVKQAGSWKLRSTRQLRNCGEASLLGGGNAIVH